jgi:hypothetical protein
MKNKLLYFLAGCVVLSSFLSSSAMACTDNEPLPQKPQIIEWICHPDGTIWVRIAPFRTFGTLGGTPMLCACSLTLAQSIGEILDAKLVKPGTDEPIDDDGNFVFVPNPNTNFSGDPQQGLATTNPVSVAGGLSAELMLNIKMGSGQSCNSVKRAVFKSTLFTGGADDDGTPSEHIAQYGPPLPADLIKFSAVPSEDAITLNWLMGSEVGVSGYRILKGEIQNVEVVSEKLISNEGEGNTGASYSRDIPNVGNGVHAYILEILNEDGSSTYHINEESVLVDGKKP